MRPQFALICHQYSIVSYGVTANASRGCARDHSAQFSFGRRPAPSFTRRSDSSGPRSGARRSTTSSCNRAERRSSAPGQALRDLPSAGAGSMRSPFRLRSGTYAWYVWPAFAPRSRTHYGNLLGQSGFRAVGRQLDASRASVEKARSMVVECPGSCNEFARERWWPPEARP